MNNDFPADTPVLNAMRHIISAIVFSLCAATPFSAGADGLRPVSKNTAIVKTDVAGIVWQLNDQMLYPKGNWEKLGARELLIQWTAVDGISYMPGGPDPSAARMPDWNRIATEPWARTVILGLAGRFDEKAARADVANLVDASKKLAALPTPLHVNGWYFPVEVDPTWTEAASLRVLLAELPRPLWLSVYDSANVGADVLASWLASWLPDDVGLFFQDGVGVHARNAQVARQYADVLAARFGQNRVRIIAEAFRPKAEGGFRSATEPELVPQLAAYEGLVVYLFDGPHYLSNDLVDRLSRSMGTNSTTVPKVR